MSYIKNRFFEEINKKADRMEDEEFFYDKTQKQINHKTKNDNGKDSKNHKNSIQNRVG